MFHYEQGRYAKRGGMMLFSLFFVMLEIGMDLAYINRYQIIQNK